MPRSAKCVGALLVVISLPLRSAAAASPAPPPAAPPPASAALVLTPCEIEHPLRLAVLPAECGVLNVAENPQDPRGRQIGLYVARVPAVSRRKLPDPLFVLAGGPGAAASDFYAGVAAVFARVQRDRDIVLVDQRGTGRSNRLDCPGDEDLTYRASDAEIKVHARQCLAILATRASVAYYTTSLAVQDLEQVRAALGYARINLYGASYGTRVAQHYLRRFPQRVRSVILDGVVPVELAIGPDTALDAEVALHDILGRCAHEPACKARFGDPMDDYQAVRAALKVSTVPVSVHDPATGEDTPFEFGRDHLASVLRLLSYTSEYAALLPLMLHAAVEREDYGPLAGQFLLAERSYGGAIAVGMHNSVVCSEDVPFFDPARVDRKRLAATYLGTAQLDGLATVCSLWPRGPVDADLHAPLVSAVPALLLSGSDDPVTPPAYAAQAARAFPHSVSLVMQGFGHGQLTVPCMDRVMAQFVAQGAVLGLDTGCTRAARPMPFFTSVNGPPP
jgi:pimeloyl-ACP methyl ester carboxylesterase